MNTNLEDERSRDEATARYLMFDEKHRVKEENDDNGLDSEKVKGRASFYPRRDRATDLPWIRPNIC